MNPISILLVDDNSTFLRVATRFLQKHDDVVVVGTARGGEEALVRSRDLRPRVVLLDLAMPDLPGLDVIPRLRAVLPEVSIIALTILDADAYRQAALAAGADAFVSKANLSTDLLPAIRRVAQTVRSGQEPADFGLQIVDCGLRSNNPKPVVSEAEPSAIRNLKSDHVSRPQLSDRLKGKGT